MSFNSFIWAGRDDNEQGDTRRLHHLANQKKATTYCPAILGFCSDTGVARNRGRIGASQGPNAIRSCLAHLPAHALTAMVDAGNIMGLEDLEQAQENLAHAVTTLLSAHSQLVVLGGGHEIAWGSFNGLVQHLSNQSSRSHLGKILIVNFDAHFDLRSSRPATSGTPFHQILEWAEQHQQDVDYLCLGISKSSNTPALFQQASRQNVHYIEDYQMQERHIDTILARLEQTFNQADHIYLSIDLDVLPASAAPGVSAPAPYGVPLNVIEPILLAIKRTGKIRLADIAELNPLYDIDQHTARIAARLAWHLLQPE